MIRRHRIPILLIAVSIFVIFFDLFTLKSALLSGDHREQQYPWAKFYQEQIRQGQLPWWTQQIQCGFPILAEGQIGAFYPLNFLFFFLLPMKIAYSYLVLFQYFLGGLFFYFLLIRYKLSRWGAFLGTLIYLFGSTQGGYFYYNYISQKTVIWLPLTLILIDRLDEKKNPFDCFLLGLTFGIQVFAGYLQIAIYSIFYSTLYFGWKLINSKQKLTLFLKYSSASLFGMIVSLVQIFPTYELSLLSSRAQAMHGLAYVGSMLPFGFITLFYPSWDGLLGSELYVGMIGFFLILTCLKSKKSRPERFMVFATIIFLLLALGKYSPLYRALVELSGFQGFRTPIKFLFFVTFSLAILASFGFDHFFDRTPSTKPTHKLSDHAFFQTLAILALLIPLIVPTALKLVKGNLLPKFQNYIVQQFHNQAGHPHTEEQYREKAASFYDALTEVFSLQNFSTCTEWILILITLAVLIASKNVKNALYTKLLFSLLLFIDLFFYGFTSIRPNFEPYASIDRPIQNKIVEILSRDKDIFRTSAVYSSTDENRILPLLPNSNMMLHLDAPGAYSPLVMKDFKAFGQGWIYTNNSLEASFPEETLILSKLPELSNLNVKYIAAKSNLENSNLNLIAAVNDYHLYLNSQYKPRAYLLTNTRDGYIPTQIIQYHEQGMTIDFEAPHATELIISQIYYPGWLAHLDGAPVKIERFNQLFQSISVPEGKHQIQLAYHPHLYLFLFRLSVSLIALGFLFCLFLNFRKCKPVSPCG